MSAPGAARHAPGEHRLARSGRTDEERAVRAGGSDLQRALAGGLPANVGKIGSRLSRDDDFLGRSQWECRIAAEGSRRLRQGADAVDVEALDESGFRAVPLRHDDPRNSNAPREQCDGQHAPDGEHFAPEGKLAERERRDGRRRDERRGLQDGERDGEVEPRPFLPQIPGREIDRDPLVRKLVAGVADRRGTADLRVHAGHVGQPDHEEPGQPQGEVDLDVDGQGARAEERGASQGSMHAGPHCERRAGKLSERDGAARPVSNWSGVPERARSAAAGNEHRPDQRDRGEEGEPPASGVRVPGGDSRARDFREPSEDGGRPPRRP